MFRFELQPVLEHRLHCEEEVQRRLGEARRELSATEQMIEACGLERSDVCRRWRGEVGGDHDPSRQEVYDQWRAELRRRERILRDRAEQTRRRVAEIRTELTAAHLEVQKFEKLRDRALEAHRAEVNRQERLFLDDMTIMRHGRHGATSEA